MHPRTKIFGIGAIGLGIFSLVGSMSLNGVNLRLGCYDNPPYDTLTLNSDGNHSFIGPNVNVFIWLSQKLNFSITLVPTDDAATIAKIGLFEATFIKIINKEIDGILGTLVISPDRAERMDYTSMVWTEPFTLVVPKPEFENRLFAFIRPFQPVVWLVLAFAIVFFVAFMSAFSWFYKKESCSLGAKDRTSLKLKTRSGSEQKEKKYFPTSISYYAVYVINILTNHGSFTPYSRYSFRILAGSWLLASLVLVNSYSSIVVSSLTVPILKPAINSFEDLKNSKDVFLIALKNVVLGMQILNAKSGTYKILGDQLRQHPDRLLFADYPSIAAKLAKGNYAFPWMNSYNRYFIATQFKKDKKCRFQLSDPLPLSSNYFSGVLQKRSKYTKPFTIGLTHLWETGLTRFWVKGITLYGAEKCFDKKQNAPSSSVGQQVAIKLEDLLSAFFIFGAGVGLSLISFAAETLTRKVTRNKRKESTQALYR